MDNTDIGGDIFFSFKYMTQENGVIIILDQKLYCICVCSVDLSSPYGKENVGQPFMDENWSKTKKSQ